MPSPLQNLLGSEFNTEWAIKPYNPNLAVFDPSIASKIYRPLQDAEMLKIRLRELKNKPKTPTKDDSEFKGKANKQVSIFLDINEEEYNRLNSEIIKYTDGYNDATVEHMKSHDPTLKKLMQDRNQIEYTTANKLHPFNKFIDEYNESFKTKKGTQNVGASFKTEVILNDIFEELAPLLRDNSNPTKQRQLMSKYMNMIQGAHSFQQKDQLSTSKFIESATTKMGELVDDKNFSLWASSKLDMSQGVARWYNSSKKIIPSDNFKNIDIAQATISQALFNDESVKYAMVNEYLKNSFGKNIEELTKIISASTGGDIANIFNEIQDTVLQVGSSGDVAAVRNILDPLYKAVFGKDKAMPANFMLPNAYAQHAIHTIIANQASSKRTAEVNASSSTISKDWFSGGGGGSGSKGSEVVNYWATLTANRDMSVKPEDKATNYNALGFVAPETPTTNVTNEENLKAGLHNLDYRNIYVGGSSVDMPIDRVVIEASDGTVVWKYDQRTKEDKNGNKEQQISVASNNVLNVENMANKGLESVKLENLDLSSFRNVTDNKSRYTVVNDKNGVRYRVLSIPEDINPKYETIYKDNNVPNYGGAQHDFVQKAALTTPLQHTANRKGKQYYFDAHGQEQFFHIENGVMKTVPLFPYIEVSGKILGQPGVDDSKIEGIEKIMEKAKVLVDNNESYTPGGQETEVESMIYGKQKLTFTEQMVSGKFSVKVKSNVGAWVTGTFKTGELSKRVVTSTNDMDTNPNNKNNGE